MEENEKGSNLSLSIYVRGKNVKYLDNIYLREIYRE
jgi:hypothetical protein